MKRGKRNKGKVVETTNKYDRNKGITKNQKKQDLKKR
jgi:hypothetical protein